MAEVRREGVDFTNSHAVYPTVTTANASAIATGHYPGRHRRLRQHAVSRAFPVPAGSDTGRVTFLEDDCILREVKAHFGDDYLGQTTLLQAARAAGYNTVVVGKKGPAAIQFLAALDSKDDKVDGPLGIFIDDATNHPTNPTARRPRARCCAASWPPTSFSATGAAAPPFTTAPNLTQQSYLLSATTQVLIPDLKKSGKPFVMLFWSRDPDATQHGATDSDGKLMPGINGTDAHAAIANADSNLKGILDALKQWGLADNTDVFVIADHGFSTIAKGIPTPDGSSERTHAAATASWRSTWPHGSATRSSSIPTSTKRRSTSRTAIIRSTATP